MTNKPKINLNSIIGGSTSIKEESTSIKEESTSIKEESTSIKDNIINIKSLNIDNIKDNKNDNIEEKTLNETKSISIDKDSNDEDLELFTNYKSDFKADEKEILNNIQKEKKKIRAKLRLPKTRLGFLLSIITVFAIVITSLFIFYPEKHSLSSYKTSLINIKTQYSKKSWENDKIQLGQNTFNIMTLKKGDTIVYKYNGTIYTKESELKDFLKKEIKKEKNKTKNKELEKLQLIKKVLIKKYTE